ncbi:Glutathione S-transferase A [Hondaea fermentalgiana]|uniref:Glutathione S-transferase A n=1 Tax=Hondaea fermentalgiana TaxID=2315210 RepID=A0A2R5GGK9_9STRA|nr:Glutathione S-transferase A [Hondaea fermentalgiana]|eukprot:GBG29735.1 Glutathione S-transferase A [Hondaea fermentalgiana]
MGDFHDHSHGSHGHTNSVVGGQQADMGVQQQQQQQQLASQMQHEHEDSDSEVSDGEGTTVVAGFAVSDPSCPLVLYWGSGSPPAWRARLCLEEKQVNYRSVMLSFEKQQHKTPQVLSLNPRGMVPIFVDGGTVLYESLGIIQYIDSEITSPRNLMPKSKRLRARALIRMNEANNVSAVVGEVVYYLRRTDPTQINADYLRVKRDALYKEIALWEGYLDASDYLAGEEVTLADISFFPTIAYTVRLGFDLSK